jgi:hypothetical protein
MGRKNVNFTLIAQTLFAQVSKQFGWKIAFSRLFKIIIDHGRLQPPRDFAVKLIRVRVAQFLAQI